ncbi:MAG: GNAT family N-acetyltransferase [Bacteroidota bacterium]|nr:GNAT family N-acetyltransferase [Bacteroidota bacterium]
MSEGNQVAKYFRRDIGWFAGMETYNAENLLQLGTFFSPPTRVILFTEEKIIPPGCWEIKLERALFQMIHEQPGDLAPKDAEIVPLGDEHIPAMLKLTELTKPGPFFSRTIEFGNYEGIIRDGQLVAMAGHRLQPFHYTELSAVCTHPNHTGKGYAGRLLQQQLAMVHSAGRIPFLHVYPDNTSAISVYQRLGFHVRKEMVVYSLEKKAPGIASCY